ncbi:MAG: hypothetical protein AAGA92_03415 [Planctomycetota bacterium]
MALESDVWPRLSAAATPHQRRQEVVVSAPRSPLSQQHPRRTAPAATLLLAALLGCGQSQPAEEFPSPGAAVVGVEQLAGKIRAQFEAGTPEKAHDAMHDIGRLLLKIAKPGFLAQLDAGVRDEMEQAAKDLLAIYTKIDGAMFHGGGNAEAPEYNDVAADIDAALATLLKLVPESERKAAAAELASDDDHGHDHGEHDHSDHDDDHDHGEGDHADHEGHDHDEAAHSEEAHDHDGDHGHDHGEEGVKEQTADEPAAEPKLDVTPEAAEPAAAPPVDATPEQ